jgi:steroid delta-isomerase-like uncharacterized protein
LNGKLEANKALIRAHYDATLNRFDSAAIAEQVADDFYDHVAGARLGPEGVKKHIRTLKTAFPDLCVIIEDIFAEGDLVAVRGHWTGTHMAAFRGIPASRQRVEFTGMVLWRVVEGKIRERWASIDMLTPLRQAAALHRSERRRINPIQSVD